MRRRSPPFSAWRRTPDAAARSATANPPGTPRRSAPRPVQCRPRCDQPPFRDFYDRLVGQNQRPGKSLPAAKAGVALTVVMRQLVITANGVARDRQPWRGTQPKPQPRAGGTKCRPHGIHFEPSSNIRRNRQAHVCAAVRQDWRASGRRATKKLRLIARPAISMSNQGGCA